MLDKGREVWHNMSPRWGNKKVERESGQIGEGMMKADWEAERPKRRRSGWKDDLAHTDQHVPARAPTMPKLRFMDGTKWGYEPEADRQEQD